MHLSLIRMVHLARRVLKGVEHTCKRVTIAEKALCPRTNIWRTLSKINVGCHAVSQFICIILWTLYVFEEFQAVKLMLSIWNIGCSHAKCSSISLQWLILFLIAYGEVEAVTVHKFIVTILQTCEQDGSVVSLEQGWNSYFQLFRFLF